MVINLVEGTARSTGVKYLNLYHIKYFKYYRYQNRYLSRLSQVHSHQAVGMCFCGAMPVEQRHLIFKMAAGVTENLVQAAIHSKIAVERQRQAAAGSAG